MDIVLSKKENMDIVTTSWELVFLEKNISNSFEIELILTSEKNQTWPNKFTLNEKKNERKNCKYQIICMMQFMIFRDIIAVRFYWERNY